MAKQMTFFMILNDPEIARLACKQPGLRLFVDLEVNGKKCRQRRLNTWLSSHTIKDVSSIRESVPEAHLLVRINPLHEGTKKELDEVLSRGANSIMLPMYRKANDVAHFVDLLDGRAEAVPLVETADALAEVPYMCDHIPLTRVHIGLNDLHIDMKLDFMFEVLAIGALEKAAASLRSHGVSFGIGGIARAGEGLIPPEMLLGEHVRLGSDAAILSRTLHREAVNINELQRLLDFPLEILKLQKIYNSFSSASPEILESNRKKTWQCITDVANSIRAHKAP